MHARYRSSLLWLGLAVAVVGCQPEGEAPAAPGLDQAALQADLERYEAARKADLHEAAALFAERIVQQYPNTPAAERMAQELPQLRAAALAEREQKRLAALWTYHEVDADGGKQYSAYVFGEAQQSDAPPLRLVLRRHPEWGQNVYLLVGDGADFRCRGECKAQLAFDGAAPQAYLISRAEDADPPAVFIEEDARALSAIDAADELVLQIELADGSTPSYRFELGGFELAKLGPELPAKS